MSRTMNFFLIKATIIVKTETGVAHLPINSVMSNLRREITHPILQDMRDHVTNAVILEGRIQKEAVLDVILDTITHLGVMTEEVFTKGTPNPTKKTSH